MAYSTPADVRLALAPTAAEQDPNTAASLADTQLMDAIREADGRIDTFIGGRYATPVIPGPDGTVEPIRSLSRDIAAYLATLTYRKSSDLTNDDPVYRRFAWSMDLLQRVADGDLPLPIPPNEDDVTDGGVTVVNQWRGDLFGPCDYGNLGWPGGVDRVRYQWRWRRGR